MIITTQDGRKLELSRKYNLHISGFLKGNEHGATLTIATFTKSKWDDVPYSERDKHPGYVTFPHELVERYGVIGEYATNTGRDIAADALKRAWNGGATEFTVPQDNFKKSQWEEFDDFCEEHGLTLVSINELGYRESDIPRNLRIWRTTDEFERRNILVANPNVEEYDINAFGGAYAKSFAKWQALQKSKVRQLPVNAEFHAVEAKKAKAARA